MTDLGFLTGRGGKSYPTTVTPSRASYGQPSYISYPLVSPESADVRGVNNRLRTLPLVPPLVYILTLNEGLNLAETLASVASSTLYVSDTLAFSEALATTRLVTVPVGETLSLSEALGYQVSLNVIVAESLAFSEAISSQNTFSVVLPITHFFSESLTSVAKFNVPLSETLALTENLNALTTGVAPFSSTSMRVLFAGNMVLSGLTDASHYLLTSTSGVPSKIVDVAPVYNVVSTGIGSYVGEPYFTRVSLGYSGAMPGQLLRLTSATDEWFGTVIAVAGSTVTIDGVLPSFHYGSFSWTLYTPPFGVDLTVTETTEAQHYQLSVAGLLTIYGKVYQQVSSFVALGEAPTVSSVDFQVSDASVLVTFSEDMATGFPLSDCSVSGPGSPRIVAARWVGPRVLYLKTTGIGVGTYTLTLPGFKDLSLNALV